MSLLTFNCFIASFALSLGHFVFVNQQMNWWDARVFCYETYGTDLAIISSASENSQALAAISSNVNNVWIGGSNYQSGIWEWSDSSIFWNNGAVSGIYTNWDSNNPSNNGNEDCTAFYGPGSSTAQRGKWTEASCDTETYEFLCLSSGCYNAPARPRISAYELSLLNGVTVYSSSNSNPIFQPPVVIYENTPDCMFCMVSLEGKVRLPNHVIPNGGLVVATLPVGARPINRIDFSQHTRFGFTRVDILPNGDIIICPYNECAEISSSRSSSSIEEWFTFNGMSYYVGTNKPSL